MPVLRTWHRQDKRKIHKRKLKNTVARRKSSSGYNQKKLVYDQSPRPKIKNSRKKGVFVSSSLDSLFFCNSILACADYDFYTPYLSISPVWFWSLPSSMTRRSRRLCR